MKKIILAFLLILSFTLESIAQSNFDISAEIRPRHQIDNKDFNSDLPSDNFTELRTRVGVKISSADYVSGFVQIQDSRIFGTEPNTLTSISNIDLHQAYFIIKNLFSVPLNLTAGRLELSYGPQRLVGAVGWHNTGRSFDGGVLQFQNEKTTIDLFAAKTNETGSVGDTNDFSLMGLYSSIKISPSLELQPFIIGEYQTGADFKRYTVGFYSRGSVGGLSHEIEGAYQLGSINKNADISAFMFAANVNYAFNAAVKPNFGLGVDYLSGDDGSDPNKYNVFNTLYATNHKYYGYMDFFIDIPSHTFNLGLMDLHAKTSISPCEKLKAALAFHLFNSNADFILSDGTNSKDFGSEIDLTLIYNYNGSVIFHGGFSLFTPGEIFKQTRGEDISTWGYLMAVVNL